MQSKSISLDLVTIHCLSIIQVYHLLEVAQAATPFSEANHQSSQEGARSVCSAPVMPGVDVPVFGSLESSIVPAPNLDFFCYTKSLKSYYVFS